MKLNLTVGHPREAPAAVSLITDVTSRVHDISRRLVLAAPEHYEYAQATTNRLIPMTLRVRYPGDDRTFVLDPQSAIGDSGLTSGCWVQPQADELRHGGDTRLEPVIATLTITSGLHAGVTFSLINGENTIGRDPASRVCLTDPSISRRHATIEIGPRALITDLGSTNGMRVDETEIPAAVLSGTHRIQLGQVDATLAFELDHFRGAAQHHRGAVAPTEFSESADALIRSYPGGAEKTRNWPAMALADSEFIRSPRVETRFVSQPVELPQPPSPPEPQRFPILAMVAPVLMGGAMFAMTQSPMSLMFIALSPLLMLGNFVDNRLSGNRKLRDKTALFVASCAQIRERLTALRVSEQAVRSGESPATAEVLSAMTARGALLWTRRPEHQTFGELRLGIGSLPSRTTITLPARNEAALEHWNELENIRSDFSRVAEVPVLERLDICGALGISGDPQDAQGLARSVLLQLAGLHSPADITLTCFDSAQRSTPDPGGGWDWLSLLPHVDSAYSPLAAPHLANDEPTAGALLTELEGLLEIRRQVAGQAASIRSHLTDEHGSDALHGEAVTALPITPVIVVLVLSDRHVDRSRLVALSDQGPDLGIHLIWVTELLTELPASCRTYVHVGSTEPHVGFVRSGRIVPLDSVEHVDGATAQTAAAHLAPVTDVGARILDESDLPKSVHLAALMPHDVIAGAATIQKSWSSTDSVMAAWKPGIERRVGGLPAIIGQGTDEALSLDIRTHGPHALVGGTTGSGKSEFLQTWIMSLAATYSPDRLTFLLVDYKGGAAFAECTDLPHTVGLVTDLNQHLVRRALTSLRAELHYREELFNTRGAKDLQMMEKRGDPDTPPTLLIVIDEFAALVGEVPEFVDGVIDVAQRGRSLGLHLIMATQRPAGVIPDNLRANTNLRVALRVADESDSSDVIGIADAAFFDAGTPGRGVAKVGPGRLTHFQTGYLGAHSGGAESEPDIQVLSRGFGHPTAWPNSAPTPTAERTRRPHSRDIEKILANVSAAAQLLHLREPRKPWLDQLPDTLALENLPSTTEAGVLIGLSDEPERQTQRGFCVNLDQVGNLGITGAGGSGKSTTLRTFAAGLSARITDDPVDIFALDYSGGSLSPLENLPTVGSVIPGSDEARVRRILRELTETLTERERRYSDARAASLPEYRVNAQSASERRIVLLIDGINAMREQHEFEYGENPYTRLTAIMAAGRPVGIHVILTADRPGSLGNTLAATIQQHLFLRLSSESDYGLVGIPADVLADAPPGRALVSSGTSVTTEVQIALYGGNDAFNAQATALESFGRQLRDSGYPATPRVRTLPRVIDRAELPQGVPGALPIGVDDTTLAAATIPTEGLFLVVGQFGSGRTTTIETLVLGTGALFPRVTKILLAARPGPLHGLGWDWMTSSADDAAQIARGLTAEITGEREVSRAAPSGGGLFAGGSLFGDDPAPADDSASASASAPADESRVRYRPDESVPLLIVIDDVAEFEGQDAESVIAALLRATRHVNALVVVKCDPNTASGPWNIFAQLKLARSGILLQPDEADSGSLLRVGLNRMKRSDFPEGRGLLVDNGRTRTVQVAIESPELAGR